MKKYGVICILVALFSTISNIYSQHNLLYWDEVQAFKKYDTIYGPPSNSILFIGSSSIRLWKDLKKSFPNHQILNRGLGGAKVEDIIFYADQLIFDYNPSQIVIYIGENDLAYPFNTAEIIFKKIKSLFDLIHQKSPETPIVFISLKPSPIGKSYEFKRIKTNDLLMKYSIEKDYISFVDVYSKMLNKNGNYRFELFEKDQLHMKPSGYKIWQKVLNPYLSKN